MFIQHSPSSRPSTDRVERVSIIENILEMRCTDDEDVLIS